MANRYWVGGTASWDGTAGTKWAATSGGTGGETVPTTADDVFFDSASTGTVTIAAGNTGAKSITCTGFTGTITGTAGITVAGSVTLAAGMTYTHTGIMTFTGTGTLTTAGKTFSAVTVDNSGITLTLGDALNISSRALQITRGTFDTANYSVSMGSLSSSNSNTRTINLGSSTVTIINTGSVFGLGNTVNLTFNAGTSQINFTAAAPQLATGNLTFNNVSFTSTTAGTATRIINGINTFNNLTLVASSTGISQLSLGANQTINGTFTCAGSSAIARGFVRSDTVGTSRTITAAAISANDCDFRDITLAGAAAGAAPTRAGDCGGNTNITFPAAKTVYRVGTNTTWAGSSSWALSSGGGGSDNNFPLPQDTIVIDNSPTITLLNTGTYNCGAFDCSNRTNALDLRYSSSSIWHGSHTLSSAVTPSFNSGQTFSGRGVMDITSAGKSFGCPFTIDTPTGTFRLLDAFSVGTSFTLTRGTLNANNYNFTFNSFTSSNTNTRTITMGSGLWTSPSFSSVWTTTITTNLTFNKDTANILLSNTSTNNRSFSGGGLSFNKLTIGGTTGTSITDISGASTSFTELASTKTVAHTVRFSSNMGTIGTWSITGTAGNVVTVDSSSLGSRRTFTLTNITSGIDYLAVTDIGELSGNKFYVGANSTDGGNNSNVYFTDPPTTAATGNMLMLF